MTTTNKVFCIGLSRTGTTSICNLLNEIGVTTIHYPVELFVTPHLLDPNLSFKLERRGWSPYRMRRYRKVVQRLKSRDDILSAYEGFADLPIPLYYKQLDKRFSGSKFIYTTRSLEKWLESMDWLLGPGRVFFNSGILDEQLIHEVYSTVKFDKNRLVETFERHDSEVKEFFRDRPADFLEVNIESGELNVENIARFLGIEPQAVNGNPPRDNPRMTVERMNTINYHLTQHLPIFGRIRKMFSLGRKNDE